MRGGAMLLRMIPTGLVMSARTTLGDKAGRRMRCTSRFILQGRTPSRWKRARPFEIRMGRDQAEHDLRKPERPSCTRRARYVRPQQNELLRGRGKRRLSFAAFHPLRRIHTCERLQPAAQQHSWRDTSFDGHGGIAVRLYGESAPLKYGHAGDGSEKIWRNAAKEHQRVDIECVEFNYRLFGADDRDDFDDVVASPPTAKASIDAASDAIVAKLTDLQTAFVKGAG